MEFRNNSETCFAKQVTPIETHLVFIKAIEQWLRNSAREPGRTCSWDQAKVLSATETNVVGVERFVSKTHAKYVEHASFVGPPREDESWIL